MRQKPELNPRCYCAFVKRSGESCHANDVDRGCNGERRSFEVVSTAAAAMDEAERTPGHLEGVRVRVGEENIAIVAFTTIWWLFEDGIQGRLIEG
jgi:hypothetical protein